MSYSKSSNGNDGQSKLSVRSSRRQKDNNADFINNSCLVNAWIFLDEDGPGGTNYNSPSSSYQRLIKNKVYQSVDILFICFVTTTITSRSTTPAGNGASYTIQVKPAGHPGGLTNQDYMNSVISDARKNNPKIKIVVTLAWDKGNLISNIFSISKYSPKTNAQNFAANLMKYLKKYDLDGFDIDWEYPVSDATTKKEFALLMNAIRAQFKQQKNKHYYLTLSPAEVGNLDADAVNNNADFINLQLYSGFTYADNFTDVGVNSNLFAYGVKFEQNQQTATGAFGDNEDNFRYNIFTSWRLNSDNYVYEQTQQQLLHTLCK